MVVESPRLVRSEALMLACCGDCRERDSANRRGLDVDAAPPGLLLPLRAPRKDTRAGVLRPLTLSTSPLVPVLENDSDRARNCKCASENAGHGDGIFIANIMRARPELKDGPTRAPAGSGAMSNVQYRCVSLV